MEQDSATSKKINLIAAIATIIGTLIAAIALIPSFGQWMYPLAKQEITVAPFPTERPTATRTPIPTSTPVHLYPPYSMSDENYLTSTPDRPFAIINNKLELPIKVYVDDIYKGIAEPLSWKTLLLDSYPVNVKWEVDRRKLNEETVMGDEMSGIFHNVETGVFLQVSNVVGNVPYFYPILSNDTDTDCTISINDGTIAEQRPGVLLAHTSNVVSGYFILYSNANVTLYCNGQPRWWGIRPNQAETPMPLSNIVDPNNGIVQLRLSP